MYFMTVLLIMGLSYILMLPKIMTMARAAKIATTAPRRVVGSALIGFLSAFLLIIYVLFLFLDFALLTPGFPIDFGLRWRENTQVLQQLQSTGTAATEALITVLNLVLPDSKVLLRSFLFRS